MSIMSFSSTPSRTSYLQAGAGWLARALKEFHYRQADHRLQGMSDAMLHDIGVGRGEIGDVVRHGRSGRR